MIIEFNGLPGSGKTSIAHDLSDALSDEGISVKTLYDVRKDAIKNLLLFRVSSLDIAKCCKVVFAYFNISKYANPLKKVTLRRFFFVAGICIGYICSHYYEETVAIVDQGIIQAFCALQCEANVPYHKIKKYCKTIVDFSGIGIFVNVNCDEELCADRIKKRIPNIKNPFDMVDDDSVLIAMLKQYSSTIHFYRELEDDKKSIFLSTSNTFDTKPHVALVKKCVKDSIQRVNIGR